MTGTTILATARSYLGRGVRYVLGADDATPPGLSFDCSAFVWRALGSRKFDGKRWRNTDWILADALGPRTLFVPVDRPEPGDVAVYGRKINGGRMGHVAIVADSGLRTIVDCSSSLGGVREHSGAYFWTRAAQGRAVFVRYTGA